MTEGEVLYNGKDLLEMKPEDARLRRVFLAFQYPVEIPGDQQRLLPALGTERHPQVSRQGRDGRDGFPAALAKS